MSKKNTLKEINRLIYELRTLKYYDDINELL